MSESVNRWFVPPRDLNELTDVRIVNPTNAQLLEFESATGLWKNKAAGGGGGDTKVELFENAIQVGTVARRLNMVDINDFILAEDVPNDWFDITINRNANNGIAGLNASGLLDLTRLSDAGFLIGDIIKHNGTDFVRFPKGTASQQIRVNVGGTDLEFFTPAGGGTGTLRRTRLEGVQISLDRANLNWLDSAEIDFALVDDAGQDETEISASIVAASINLTTKVTGLLPNGNLANLPLLGTNPASARPINIVNAEISATAAIAQSKLVDIVNADVAAGAAIAQSKLVNVVNADVAAGAAIAYAKLALANSIVNADVNTAAAIAYSKLNLSTSIVNADIAVAAAIAYSKLNLTGLIVNADIAAAAAIDLSKLNDTGFLLGDLIKHNGTDFVRFAKGTGAQQIRVNAGGTDLEFFTPAGGAGEANTISSLGGGTVLVAAVPKLGVDLRTVSVATTAPIAHSTTADLLTFTLNALVNADISASAAIAYSKLNLTNSIVNADIAAGAAIAQSKLVNIVNADVAAGAAILQSKLAALVKANQVAATVYEDEANTWGTPNQNIAATGRWQEAGKPISPIGLHDIYIAAGAFDEVTASAIATRIVDAGIDRKVLRFMSFLNGAVQFGTVMFQLPRNYNNGTITAIIHWTSAVEGAGTVEWDISAAALADPNSFATVVFGTAITVTDTQTTINQEQLTPRSAAITIGNVPADQDMIVLKVQRDGVADTFTQPAQFLGIAIEISTDQAVSP